MSLRHRFNAVVGTLSIALLASCHHKARDSEMDKPLKPTITREDIEKVHARTALDAVQRLRGDVLVSRYAPSSILLNKQLHPVVFLNDQYYGAIDELRHIPAGEVEEIRILNGSDAVQKFGSQFGGGVIQIISRVS
jgi:glutaredoxin